MPNILLSVLAIVWVISFVAPGQLGPIETMLLPVTIVAVIWRILHSVDGTMDS
jgi:hypothetical protein